MSKYDNVCTTNELRVTNDYDKFTFFSGNREIDRKNVENIKQSIKDKGWIMNPIIVDSQFRIGDGQHRYMSLKELGMPIYYIIDLNMTLDKCIALNNNQKNWNIENYVRSFSDNGFDSYTWALEMKDKYPRMSLQAILALCCTDACRTDFSGSYKYNVTNGGMELDDDTRLKVDDVLEYIYKFVDAVINIKGRKFLLFNAIIFLYREKQCDNARLLHVVTKYAGNKKKFQSRTTSLEYIADIEKAYNCNLPANKRIYIKSNFEQYSSIDFNEYYSEED